MKTKLFSVLQIMIVLGGIVLVGVAVNGDEEPESGGDSSETGSGGMWQSNNRAVDSQAYCDAHHPYTVCTEWCEGPMLNPTGILCCIDPWDADSPEGSRSDCQNLIGLVDL
ncbi:MAG: hypothetical protein K0U98_00315 [Deltaproteobacteria bacterium]|nr:hypothetical protein [Deltaproteobacteria bacterium]